PRRGPDAPDHGRGPGRALLGCLRQGVKWPVGGPLRCPTTRSSPGPVWRSTADLTRHHCPPTQENNMSPSSARSKHSEKGLLTPDNCVLTLIDLQPQMLFGVANFDRQSIINNNVAIAKASRVFKVPVVLSTVETKAFSGNMWPQMQAVFPGQVPIERTSMNSWDDKNFVAAIQKSGRKKIVLTGLWTETCVALPTIQAIHDGYEVYVVED